MPIAWKPPQAQKVTNALAKYPPQSNRCELAAKAILPVARQVDSSSRALKIKPAGRARYLMTNVSLNGEWWRHHVTTEVSEHYVDSLTGTPGTLVIDYFTEHYQVDEPDAYIIQNAEL